MCTSEFQAPRAFYSIRRLFLPTFLFAPYTVSAFPFPMKPVNVIYPPRCICNRPDDTVIVPDVSEIDIIDEIR